MMSASKLMKEEIVEDKDSTKEREKENNENLSSSAQAFAKLGIRENGQPVKLDDPSITPLESHIAYFADSNGYVTHTSMKDTFVKLGDSEWEATKKATKVMLLGGTAVRHCPFATFKPKEAVGTLNHARDTQIYKSDGTCDMDERWKKLCEYAEVDKGTDIITEKRFYEFLQWCRDNDPRWDILGFGKAASDAEWSDFFKKFTNYWKQSDNKQEAAVTLALLKQFYLKSPEAFDKVAAKELPVLRPGRP